MRSDPQEHYRPVRKTKRRTRCIDVNASQPTYHRSQRLCAMTIPGELT
jgi:hypothetical protein